MAQIQLWKHVLDGARGMAPTRQHELDHTDHTDQEYTYLPCLADLEREVGIDLTDHTDHLAEVCHTRTRYQVQVSSGRKVPNDVK